MPTYQETLDYLFSRLPMFTRIGVAAFKKDLTNTLALCSVLQQPQLNFPCIHVAGTNGKGSTSHMIASVLQEAGYKAGLYTSPHLKDFRERIRINGQMIPEQFVVDFVQRYKTHFDRIGPSFFEWTVALCFHYFSNEQVDVAVIETGLGGRLDSTNVIRPVLSVITNIGWDHTDMLGDTLEKIAAEKAGIIKAGVPVVIGEEQEETLPVFAKKAAIENSRLLKAFDAVSLAGIGFDNNRLICDARLAGMNLPGLQCDLPGIYQQHNLKTALAAIGELIVLGYRISEEHIRNGLGRVKPNTGLAGRWQVLGEQPLVVADTGHNINGIGYVLQQIATQTFNRLHIVIGMVKDKDITKVLDMLPGDATYYFTQAAIPRALPAEELAALAASFSLSGKVYASVSEARQAALDNAGTDDLIFIGGSTFIVAEAL